MKYENLEPGYYYHVYNQGNNKENIFYEQRNYNYFLSLLKKYIVPLAEMYAYCPLPNHFHLLLRVNDDTEKEARSQAFSNFFNAYAKAINKTYHRTGSLFKRKISRIKVKNEDYLKRQVIYIHTNAQHHGLVEEFEKHLHSSFRAYLSKRQTSISKSYILDLFGGVENFKALHRTRSDYLDMKMENYFLE